MSRVFVLFWGSGKHLTHYMLWGPSDASLACPSALAHMQSPPDGFVCVCVCVPFYLAVMVATRLFIGSRKEHPQSKRLPATWGLGVLGEGARSARVVLFPQTSEVRFQKGGSTTCQVQQTQETLGGSQPCPFSLSLLTLNLQRACCPGGLVLRPIFSLLD